jgi:hypothetical protein
MSASSSRYSARGRMAARRAARESYVQTFRPLHHAGPSLDRPLGSSWDRTFGHAADPTLGDLVLVFLFVLLAVSALAPPARNHSAFVSFLFVADLLVFGWFFFFADFFVFIGYLLVRGAI